MGGVCCSVSCGGHRLGIDWALAAGVTRICHRVALWQVFGSGAGSGDVYGAGGPVGAGRKAGAQRMGCVAGWARQNSRIGERLSFFPVLR